VLAAVVMACAAGCASVPADYWQNSYDPYPVVSVQYVADPGVMCGEPADGCTVRNPSLKTARIYIKAGMPEWKTQCTLRHEEKHANGYTHRKGLISDCYY